MYMNICTRAWAVGIRESVGEFVAFEPYFDEAAAWGHVGMVSKALLGAVQEERLTSWKTVRLRGLGSHGEV